MYFCFCFFLSLAFYPGQGLGGSGAQGASQEYTLDETPWAIYQSQSTEQHVFGMCQETRGPEGNPCGHREKM